MESKRKDVESRLYRLVLRSDLVLRRFRGSDFS